MLENEPKYVLTVKELNSSTDTMQNQIQKFIDKEKITRGSLIDIKYQYYNMTVRALIIYDKKIN